MHVPVCSIQCVLCDSASSLRSFVSVKWMIIFISKVPLQYLGISLVSWLYNYERWAFNNVEFIFYSSNNFSCSSVIILVPESFTLISALSPSIGIKLILKHCCHLYIYTSRSILYITQRIKVKIYFQLAFRLWLLYTFKVIWDWSAKCSARQLKVIFSCYGTHCNKPPEGLRLCFEQKNNIFSTSNYYYFF